MKQNKTKKLLVFAFTFGISVSVQAFISTSPDSLRSEVAGGQSFVIHKVDAGQTLYAVMRKYKTTIQALRNANPDMKDNLTTGQVIRVPYQKKTTTKVPSKVVEKPKEEAEEKIVIKPIVKEPEKVVGKPQQPDEDKIVISPQNTEPEKEKKETQAPEKVEPKEPRPQAVVINKSGLHRVEAGQSLYGIAVKYGVLMTELRHWNSLNSDQLREGQDLVVTESAYRELLKKTKTDSVKVVVNKPVNTEKPMLPAPPPIPSENSNLPDPRIVNTGKRIIETGMAEVIDVADNSNKYLALHRTASIGSLVQVKNTSNNQSVWVKVIGKLPNISVNDRIIIKVSARAYEKLSPNGRRFLSEISYSNE
jgi:LysM repeat protein